MANAEKPFVGEFKEILEAFINQKRNLGYKYDITRDNLRRFSEYTLNFRIENKYLDKELVLGWTERRQHESVKTWKNRTSYLRQFGIYLQSKGYKAFILNPRSHKVIRSDYIPYIFNHEEIACFFKVVDTIKPHPLSNKHTSYPLLFRLLYCCGLRISEARHLKISDVDLDNGVLHIKKSKFNKDRLIPMSASLTEMFAKYQGLFNEKNLKVDYFFRNKNGTPIKRDWIYKGYRKLLWKAGISHGGKGIGPRLHDFRHTFCVHTLIKQVNDGVDLYITLPILSVYVGHSSVGATQRYVRLTAESYPELIENVSRTCEFVIPEVKDETN